MLLVWAVRRGGGLGHILDESSGCRPDRTPFWRLFPSALTANVGYWATLSLNIPDFTRYARSQRSQALGQALGLPATMTAFAFIGVAVTSATIVVFGEPIWDPVALIARIGSAPAIIFGALVVMLAQLTTNMAANVVSPANDFSSLAPTRISYVTGGLITAAIGIVMMPWKLYADASAYIFTWLIGYSSLMGAIGGVLIADYWVLRRRELSTADLFKLDGRYSYTRGVNPSRDGRAWCSRSCRSSRASSARRRRLAARCRTRRSSTCSTPTPGSSRSPLAFVLLSRARRAGELEARIREGGPSRTLCYDAACRSAGASE